MNLLIAIPIGVITSLYSVLASLLPFLPKLFNQHRHALLNGSDSNAAALDHAIHRYQHLFSAQPPPFYPASYRQLISEVKSKLIFALVYLHSEDHDDTPSFCQQTLADPDVLNLIREHEIAVYFGPMDHPEPFEVSSLLSATGYPFLALITLTSVKGVTRPAVVFRSEGFISPTALVSKLTAAIQTHGLFVATIRQERQLRESDRSMRAMQDEAYQASLLRDRERQRLLDLEAEQARQVEEKRAARRQLLINELNNSRSARSVLREKLDKKSEPSPGTPNRTLVQVRLPNGARLRRAFLESDPVRHLYEYVEVQDPCGEDAVDEEEWVDQHMSLSDTSDEEEEGVAGFKFVLTDPFPRNEHRDIDISIAESGLCNGNVIVEL